MSCISGTIQYSIINPPPQFLPIVYSSLQASMLLPHYFCPTSTLLLHIISLTFLSQCLQELGKLKKEACDPSSNTEIRITEKFGGGMGSGGCGGMLAA